MKKTYFFVLAVVSASLFISCNELSGSGVLVSETRTIRDFHGLDARQGFEVELREGSKPEVVIEADDNVINDVEARVDDDGILHLGVDHNHLVNVHLKAVVTYQKLDEIRSSSGAQVTGSYILKADRMEVNASSGSGIKLKVDAPSVEANSSSGSTVKLSGRTRNYAAEASSGGSIDSEDLLSERAAAHASSAGDIELHASVAVDAHASSGGSIHYRGKPSQVKQESSSGGTVESVN
jgi:hypothetical protein